MSDTIQLPDFCTIPLVRPRSVDVIERVYHRNRMRFEFLIEQGRCSQDEFDKWCASLDQWREYALRMIKEL